MNQLIIKHFTHLYKLVFSFLRLVFQGFLNWLQGALTAPATCSKNSPSTIMSFAFVLVFRVLGASPLATVSSSGNVLQTLNTTHGTFSSAPPYHQKGVLPH